MDKATAAKAILRDLGMDRKEIDFLLCIGDGRTDEVVFSLLHDTDFALTSTVGKKQTEGKEYVITDRYYYPPMTYYNHISLSYLLARYYLDTVQEVEALLSALVRSVGSKK